MSEPIIDFGKEKVSTLFNRIFFPTLLGMLSMAAVSTIDGIFVGHGVGSDGIAAINICIPLLMVLTGIGLMIGMGCSVTASIHLAHEKPHAARASVTQALLSVTLIGGSVLLVLFLNPDTVLNFLGASSHLMPLAKEYLLWFAPSLLAELWVAVAQFVLRLDGAPKLAMWCNVITAVVNVVLDWIFIFPLQWGVMGAALATTIACMVGAVIVGIYLFSFAHTFHLCPLRLNRKGFLFYINDLIAQCRVGASALLGEATMAMLMFVGNHVFSSYLGDYGVGAFGISCYYLPFVFMIGNSIAQSAQPIISFNYGANQFQRVQSALHYSLFTAIVCGFISTIAFIFCPHLLVSLFLPLSDPAAQIAVKGFPFYGMGFIFFVVNLSAIGYYQSVERVKPATLFALMRGFILLIPAFLLLPRVLGIEGIWLSMPISESLTTFCILLALLTQRFFHSNKAVKKGK